LPVRANGEIVNPVKEAVIAVASLALILGLKFLSSPKTARRGNAAAGLGMALAILVVLGEAVLRMPPDRLVLLIATVGVGSIVGWGMARRVKMTAMPQMIAIFNGVGGGAAALVAALDLVHHLQNEFFGPDRITSLLVVLGLLIGSVSFSGSALAYAKLEGLIGERPITYPFQRSLNFLLLAGTVFAAGVLVWEPRVGTLGILVLLALLMGIVTVLPIGGADMPVVISLLNSFTGLAVAADGFLLHNKAMIIAGTLVGASGTLLTVLMCRAMNRSLLNVLLGGFGKIQTCGVEEASRVSKTVREGQPEDAAALMAYARSVVVVPGYGMAVAQAQHPVKELADLLTSKGVQVKYAIHPVAGRMPGHMNVLLAEANVPYEQLYDLEQINGEFPNTDVALVLGANDVVNPAARHDRSSPIYGMPILDVDRAGHVIVIKRSMSPGFAGIDNELFYHPKTMMVFGDAKTMVMKMIQSVKEL
jgi:proton-translocating NAD(P)+ transhydrogenase subunit beta